MDDTRRKRPACAIIGCQIRTATAGLGYDDRAAAREGLIGDKAPGVVVGWQHETIACRVDGGHLRLVTKAEHVERNALGRSFRFHHLTKFAFADDHEFGSLAVRPH